MFDFIKNILGTTKPGADAGKPPIDGHIALCVLLLETAYADGECSAEELEHLRNNLITTFQIPPGDIDGLLENSRNQRKESVDIFRFTRYLNNNFSRDEKKQLMASVWSIILIDDHLEAHEDHFAHKLANLLRLTHGELIDAKLAARKQMEVQTR